MGNIQIDENEYRRLQGQDQIAKFIGPIYDDPQLNKEAKALIKKKYPNLNIPDYDLMQQVDRRFDEEKQARETAERTRREEQEQARFQETRTATQKKYGFTDEGMTELERLMVERNVGDYDIAAEHLVAKQPKPSDSNYDDFGRTRWNHSKAPDFVEIAKDPEAWGQNEIMKALRADQERAKQQRF